MKQQRSPSAHVTAGLAVVVALAQAPALARHRHGHAHATHHLARVKIPPNTSVVAARRKEAAIQQKLAQAKAMVVHLKHQEAIHVEKLTELQQTVDDTTQRLQDSTFRLDRAQRELARTKSQLTVSRARFKEEQVLAAGRLRAIFKAGQVSHWEALLTAPNLVDFLTRYQYFKHISDQDERLLTDLASTVGDIRQKKHRMDDLVTTTERFTQSIQAQRAAQVAATQQESQLVNQIRSQREAWEREQDQLESSSREIEAMIRRLMATRVSHPRLGTGRFIWPLLTRIQITSPFGERFHPIFHVYRMHTGVDLRAPMGTPVVAADTGVVLFSGWYDGYGKVVMIDHGAGLVTLYAHLSRWLVHAGDHVTRGQVIARSGSTGFATGPHLHFEVRKNGTPVNPLGYLR
ncbi:MAG: peptidoglycan DD-metalloendopeptidase family protein [Cyanobacteria bacterium REEB65]|nr:peptidoglycan DD-metalloendopeptidase family protein [Cyanobacteria bacterium REEB65]